VGDGPETHLVNPNPSHRVGDIVDNLNGVPVYYNGDVHDQDGQNFAPDGYDLGVKYQCVEFVKRYYDQHLGVEIPDPSGDAVDFYDKSLIDGAMNARRGLLQLRNGGQYRPMPDDMVVFDNGPQNRFGHVAIIASVSANHIEIVQQNAGPFTFSRAIYPLHFAQGHWRVTGAPILGWLRRPGPGQKG
jgi:hypothetical protein